MTCREPCGRAMFLADEARMPALRVLRWLCPVGHSRHERIRLTPPERAVEPKWGREITTSTPQAECGACRRAFVPPCAAHGGIPTAERKRRNSRARSQRLRERRLALA